GIALEPRRGRRRQRVVGERVQHTELGLEVVGLEQPGDRLALDDVAAAGAADLDVERERLLREPPGAATAAHDPCAVADPGGEDPLQPSSELRVVHAQARKSASAAATAADCSIGTK